MNGRRVTFQTAHNTPLLRDTPHPFPCCLGHGHPRLPLEGTWGFPARGATRELGRRGTGYGQRAAAGIPRVADCGILHPPQATLSRQLYPKGPSAQAVPPKTFGYAKRRRFWDAQPGWREPGCVRRRHTHRSQAVGAAQAGISQASVLLRSQVLNKHQAHFFWNVPPTAISSL